MKDSDLAGIEQEPKFSYGYNMNDKPKDYVGKRRAAEAGDLTLANIESAEPVVYLGVETVQGLGDSVIAASMSFNTVVASLQKFSEPIDGEIFPERNYLPSAGEVRMRKPDGTSSPYRVVPHVLQ